MSIKKEVETVGGYILYNGYFLFMFGFGSNLNKNELGIVRFGGHKELNENIFECISREIKEEVNLDISHFKNKISYYYNNFKCKKINYNICNKKDIHCPILITRKNINKLSLMFLVYGKGKLEPKMETQGILLLRIKDIEYICSNNISFEDYINIGGKFILSDKLSFIKNNPKKFFLIPKIQLLFLNNLFKLEPQLMNDFILLNNKDKNEK